MLTNTHTSTRACNQGTASASGSSPPVDVHRKHRELQDLQNPGWHPLPSAAAVQQNHSLTGTFTAQKCPIRSANYRHNFCR